MILVHAITYELEINACFYDNKNQGKWRIVQRMYGPNEICFKINFNSSYDCLKDGIFQNKELCEIKICAGGNLA